MEEIGIESTLVEAIKSGDKTIEARLGKPRFLRMQEGDILSVREDFWHDGKILESLPYALQIKITQVLYFETFADMFKAIDFQAAVPAAQTAEDAVKQYREFYTKENEYEFGVISFSFELT